MWRGLGLGIHTKPVALTIFFNMKRRILFGCPCILVKRNARGGRNEVGWRDLEERIGLDWIVSGLGSGILGRRKGRLNGVGNGVLMRVLGLVRASRGEILRRGRRHYKREGGRNITVLRDKPLQTTHFSNGS